MAKTILVIGANRGIGLNLVKAFGAKNWTVFGSVRPQTIKEGDPSIKEASLEATGAKILEIDFLNEDTIKNAAAQYGTGSLDILINCGGVSVAPRNLDDHDQETLMNRFAIMAAGPYLTTKAFLPNISKSHEGKVINMSSDFGSVGKSVGKGGFFGYRMAKAALNQFTVTLAKELKVEGSSIIVLSVNPGFVSTRLTNFDGEDDMDTSIKGLVKIIEEADASKSGHFINWNGKEIPF